MIEVVKWRPDGTPKTFRLQSTLYDSLFPKAKEMGFFHVLNKSDPTFGTQQSCIRRLVEHLYINNGPPSGKSIENVHSYLSFNKKKRDKPAEEADDFLHRSLVQGGFRLLRLLDLEHVYKPVLPETLGEMNLLRYLGLRWTFIDSIPLSIGYIPCIESLDIKHTHITTLPKSIWMAKKLRHLYLNEIEFPMVQNKSASVSLCNLQTLSGLFIGQRCPPTECLGRINRLRKLGVTFNKASHAEIISWISGLASLEYLRLRSIDDFNEPSVLKLTSINNHEKLTKLYLLGKLVIGANLDKVLPQNLTSLTLSVSELVDDPMPMLGNLKQLNLLNLFADSYLGGKMTCNCGAFPKLKVLRLWMLKELQTWTIEAGAMPLLGELEIRKCPELRYIFGLEYLITLKELILVDTTIALELLQLRKPSKWTFDIIKDSSPEEAKNKDKLICQVRGPVLVPLRQEEARD